jgi:hypothetical protein
MEGICKAERMSCTVPGYKEPEAELTIMSFPHLTST